MTFSLRRILTLTALLLGLLPALIGVLGAHLWLMPRIETQAITANTALARALAHQTSQYLEMPAQSLRLAARDPALQALKRQESKRLVEWLLNSSPSFQAVYALDSQHKIMHASVRGDSTLQMSDLLGLDLSRLHSLGPPLLNNELRWTEVFLSSVSGRPAVAAIVASGHNFLVGEIALSDLSQFVRTVALSNEGRMIIMDDHGIVVADPDPDLASAYVNRSDIELFRSALATGSAAGHFKLDGRAFIGSALRTSPLNWVVLVAEPAEQALRSGWQILSLLIFIGLGMLGLTLLTALICANWIASHTERIVHIAKLAARNDFDFHWPSTRIPEHQQLLGSLRAMLDALRAREQALNESNTLLEARVQDRTQALSEANEELSATVEHLKHARNELAHSERQAALGRLVAGVAHELNTPIGNSLLVANTLYDQAIEFNQRAEQGITRRNLDEFRLHTTDAAAQLTQNLQKAAELIRDFKQVAADQTTAQRRRFDLGELLNDIARMLSPTLRRTPIHLRIDASKELSMTSYPGPLGQVVSNLVQNALEHAYADRSEGEIVIHAEALGEKQILLSVSDQGCGIPAETLPHIFDPFFTTRMGQGGTGLGLHIAYQIVSELLEGSIEVKSEMGTGSSFTLIIPREPTGNPTEDTPAPVLR